MPKGEFQIGHVELYQTTDRVVIHIAKVLDLISTCSHVFVGGTPSIPLGDDALTAIAELTGLKHLSLASFRFSDESHQRFKDFVNLEQLEFTNVGVTKTLFSSIVEHQKHVVTLAIHDFALVPMMVEPLARIKQLRHLSLSLKQSSQELAAALAASPLETLPLRSIPSIEVNAMEAIALQPCLHSLSIHDDPLTRHHLNALIACQSLKPLSLKPSQNQRFGFGEFSAFAAGRAD